MDEEWVDNDREDAEGKADGKDHIESWTNCVQFKYSLKYCVHCAVQIRSLTITEPFKPLKVNAVSPIISL